MSKPSLAEAMTRVASRNPTVGRVLEPTPAVDPMPTLTPDPAPQAVAAHKPKTARPKGREGKKVISGFFDKEVSKQFSRLAIDRDCSNEALLGEALNDLFNKYHLPPIA